MGCLNAKLVPGVDPDGPLPEPVFTGGQSSKLSKEKLKQFDDIATMPSPVQVQTPRLERTEPPPGPASAKCKVQIDSRVTAKYDIKALIGKGSFSRVLRVENKQSRQPYAIKIIDRAHEQGEIFQSELDVLRRVRHRYIIRLVEVFESRHKVYMVMELATGGELFDRIISKGSFSERDAIGVMQMVMEGLKYLHDLGICHRDLKPENLLYYHPGLDSKILITDFGLSATTSKTGKELMKTTCGTPEYIAPEIIQKYAYNCLVDEWAAGVICYIMLSGTMPFDDENRQKLYKQIVNVKYSYDAEPWNQVSENAKDFINLLLVRDPALRLTAAQALKHPWLQSTSAASTKNLHRTISSNLIHRQQSTRANSTKSNKSNRSSKSNRSNRSLRSEHRRVLPEEIEQLHADPEFQKIYSQYGSKSDDSASSETNSEPPSTPKSEQSASNTGQTTPDSEQSTSNTGQTAPNNEQSTSNTGQTAPNNEQSTSNTGQTAPNTEQSTDAQHSERDS